MAVTRNSLQSRGVGAPAHVIAKSDAMLVALVLGAAAVVAVIRGNGVFGIFAANGQTEIVWGAVALLLAIVAMLPRLRRIETVGRDQRVPADRVEPGVSPVVSGRDEPAL